MDGYIKKRAFVLEEYSAITNNVFEAILLNQFVYWARIKMRADELYAKEFAIYEQCGEAVNYKPSYGWIYKTAEELNQETMLKISDVSVRRHIKSLIDAGYISERRNPYMGWDKTLQYHVNLAYINEKVKEHGLTMDGFVFENDIQNVDNGNYNMKDEASNCSSKLQIVGAIPKITNIYNNNLDTTSSLKVEVDSKAIVSTKAIVNTKASSTTVDTTDNILTKGSSSIGKRKDKIKYAEFVSMTQEEHDKLEEKYGPVALSEMIYKLDNYKGASGKRYKSDYRAILSWVVQSYMDEHKNAQNGFLRDNNPVAGMQGALEILSKGGGFFD